MKPVFIFGCDRSGTTMLGSLLGSHSRAVTTPESQFVTEVYRACLSGGEAFEVARAVARIKAHFRFKVWNFYLDEAAVREAGVTSYAELIVFIVRQYAEAVGRAGAEVWVDHTPVNCMYAHTLATLFPEARFVHMVRDGRAVAASLMSLPWKFHSAHKVSEYWLRRLGQGFAAEAHFGPERCPRVRYEDVVLDSETQLKKLCTLLGLEFETQMLAGSGFAVPEYTAKEHALVGRPAEAARVSAWEKKLSGRDVEIFESSSGDVLRYLGYTPKVGVAARRQTRLERYRDGLLDVFFYRRYDGFKERRKRSKLLAQLSAKGFINRPAASERTPPERRYSAT